MESYVIARTFVFIFIFRKTTTLSKMFGTSVGDYDIINDVRNFRFCFLFLSWEHSPYLGMQNFQMALVFFCFSNTQFIFLLRNKSTISQCELSRGECFVYSRQLGHLRLLASKNHSYDLHDHNSYNYIVRCTQLAQLRSFCFCMHIHFSLSIPI